MRCGLEKVHFPMGHFSPQDLELLSSIRDCVVVVERLSDEFIANAIAGKSFASEKKKPKKIKTKKQRKESEHKKRQKKRKLTESESEKSDENESDEDYVVTSLPSSTGRRGLRSNVDSIEHDFEPPVSSEFFSCKNCVYVTNTEQHFLQHSSRHKNICSFCQHQFASKAECEAHLAKDHVPVVEKVITYKCKKCKEYFTIESDYKNHLLSHLDNSSEEFLCCFCGSLFAKHSNLINHVQRTHVEYKCTFCDISAPKFNFLERHCQTLHSYWGRPFECEYCDFKFAVYGCLLTHRSEYHAIEFEEGEDKCRFCHLVLGNQENAVQHFAKHLRVSLFKCYLCEFCSNSREEMTEHSKMEHSKPEIFAKHIETSELMEMVKEHIKSTFNQPASEVKQPRQKPTAVETKEAIAAILCPDESLDTFDSIFDENGVVEEITAIAPNLGENDVILEEENSCNQRVLRSGVKSSISTLVKVPENKVPEKSPKGKQRRGRKRKKETHKINENTEKQSEQNGNVEDIDPFEVETDVESDQEQKQRAIMSVDPVTNRLYVNGVPVFDEFGNEVFVVNQFVEQNENTEQSV